MFLLPLIHSADLLDYFRLPPPVMSIHVISVSSPWSLPSLASLHSFFLLFIPFGLLFFYDRLLNLRLLCQAPTHQPLSPFHSFFPPHSFPPMFSFADSLHSLPLSSALSPHYKDSHWRTWTFYSSRILPLILLSCCSVWREDQLKSVSSPSPLRCSALSVSALALSRVTY